MAGHGNRDHSLLHARLECRPSRRPLYEFPGPRTHSTRAASALTGSRTCVLNAGSGVGRCWCTSAGLHCLQWCTVSSWDRRAPFLGTPLRGTDYIGDGPLDCQWDPG